MHNPINYRDTDPEAFSAGVLVALRLVASHELGGGKSPGQALRAARADLLALGVALPADLLPPASSGEHSRSFGEVS